MTALELVLGTQAAAAASNDSQRNVAAHDYFLQGLAYLRAPLSAKSIESAEQLFRRALAEQPDFARAQAGLCETLVDRYTLERQPAHVTAAESACAAAEALDRTAQEVHVAIGQLRLATGKPAEAELAFRDALALAPQSSDVLIGLGDALDAGGKFDEADAAYRQAIAAQPRYAGANIAYGNFLLGRGRPADAIPAYERATLFSPDNTNAFNNLGAAYLYLGDFEQGCRRLPAIARTRAAQHQLFEPGHGPVLPRPLCRSRRGVPQGGGADAGRSPALGKPRRCTLV